jgi:hypothetical protein
MFFMTVFYSLMSVTVFCQDDKPVLLNRAISGSISYIAERLDIKTRVAVLNFTAPIAVSNYVMEESSAFLVNNEKFIVVDRTELELLQREMDFQLSGEVSDESAQSIGERLGAQIVISGSFVPIGNMWRMRIKALEVATGRIRAVSAYTVKRDALLASLLSDHPKTILDKAGAGALNIAFGLGSWLDGDFWGGFTLATGYAAAIGLFVFETAALDWDSPLVGIPATIGVSVAGLTLVYGFVRPFIYNRYPKIIAFLDNTEIKPVAAASENRKIPYPERAVKLSYSFKW